MSNLKHKAAAMMLIVTLLLLTACSGGKNTDEPAGSADPSGTEQPSTSATSDNAGDVAPDPLGKYDPPIEISVGRTTDNTVKFLDGESFENNAWQKEYADVLGLDVKYNWIVDSSQWDSKLNVTIASGDLPDLMSVPLKQYKMLVDADQIADLTDVFDKYASPLTKKILMSDPKMVEAVKTDGKLMGIPGVGSVYDQADVLWIRTDWLKKLNLDPPKTIDDVVKIADAFTKNDPDGNGKPDTFGLGIYKTPFDDPTHNGGFADLLGFANGFHAYPKSWIDVNGKLEYGSTQPEMKQTLQKLQEMYKNGLIDPEFIVKDGGKVAESVDAGKVGMVYGRYWDSIWPFQDLKNQNPDSEWQSYAIVSADGQPAKVQVDVPLTGFTVVRKGYEHPEAAIKALNLMFENYYGSRSAHWTPIDQDKKYLDKGVLLIKYPIIFMEPPTMNMDTQVKILQALKDNDPSVVDDLNTKRAYDAIMKYRSGDKTGWAFEKMFGENSGQAVYQTYKANDQILLNKFYGVPGPVMTEKLSTLQKMEDEEFTKIIMNTAPIDDFDNFVQQWKTSGGDEVEAEVNSWYATNK